jgi:molybdenum cofactor biosynthesis enzyme MoaA
VRLGAKIRLTGGEPLVRMNLRPLARLSLIAEDCVDNQRSLLAEQVEDLALTDSTNKRKH